MTIAFIVKRFSANILIKLSELLAENTSRVAEGSRKNIKFLFKWPGH